MQDQAFLGPESGLAVPAGDGGVDLYVATQWLHIDQQQICRALGLPPDLAWASLELFAYRPSIDSGRAFVTEDVVLGEAELNWLLSPLPCSVSHFDSPLTAILVGRRGLPVVARLKPDSFVDCPPSAEGYAY